MKNYTLQLRELGHTEVQALSKAVKNSSEISVKRSHKVAEKCREYQKQRFEGEIPDVRVELTSKDLNSIVISLSEVRHKNIPEKYEDTPSSGLAGDMSNHYKNEAKDGCDSLISRIKRLQE